MDFGQFMRLVKTFLFVWDRGTLEPFFDVPCINSFTYLLIYIRTFPWRVSRQRLHIKSSFSVSQFDALSSWPNILPTVSDIKWCAVNNFSPIITATSLLSFTQSTQQTVTDTIHDSAVLLLRVNLITIKQQFFKTTKITICGHAAVCLQQWAPRSNWLSQARWRYSSSCQQQLPATHIQSGTLKILIKLSTAAASYTHPTAFKRHMQVQKNVITVSWQHEK